MTSKQVVVMKMDDCRKDEEQLQGDSSSSLRELFEEDELGELGL